MHFAWQWRQAQRRARALTAALNQVRKQWEAAHEQLQRQLTTLEERCVQWVQAHRQSCDLGERIRAQRLPRWQFILRVVIVAVAAFGLCLLCDGLVAEWVERMALRLMVYGCVAACLSGWYATRAYLTWQRPTPRQLYAQRALLWRDDALQLTPRRTPQAPALPAPAMQLSAAHRNGQPTEAQEVRRPGA